MQINIDMVYPIGTIYETTSTVHPDVMFGGTWKLYGAGRVTVCIDSNQTEFSSIGKTGGSKFLQKHNHTPTAYTVAGTRSATVQSGGSYWSPVGDISGMQIGYSGEGDSQNLQPYIVVYRYRRVA